MDIAPKVEQETQENSLRTKEELIVSLKKVEYVRQLVLSENLGELSYLGFDPELLPIMKVFAENGPAILGTFSHPTELDVYKIKSSILLTNLCIEANLSPSIVKTIQLDTRRVHPSSKRPLGVGEFGLKSDKDPLCLCADANRQERLNAAPLQFANLLQNELTAELNKLETTKQQGKIIRSQILDLFANRLNILLNIYPTIDFSNELAINIAMKNFNIDLAEIIFSSESTIVRQYIHNLGTKTLSEDLEYKELIASSLTKIIKVKGIEVIKSLSDGSKDQAILRAYSGGQAGQVILTSLKEFKLEINGSLQLIDDSEFLSLLPNSIALGKLESLALVAGGLTIHVGSDRGSSLNAIRVLGLKNQAAELIESNMTFGERNIHGHDGILLGKNLVPLPLLYLMLGKDGSREIINQSQALEFQKVADLKVFFVKSLINNILNN